MKFTLNNKEIELTQEDVDDIIRQNSSEFKKGDKYWGISLKGKIGHDVWLDDEYDKAVQEMGNAFHTEEEAERERDRRKIKARLWKWAKDNAPFEPDWNDSSELKWFVYYDHGDKKVVTTYNRHSQKQTELPYFKFIDVDKFREENLQDLTDWFNK